MKKLSKIIAFVTVAVMLISVLSISCLAMEDLDWEISVGALFKNAIAANDNICISVGDNGIIFKSTDGTNWTQQKIATNYDLNDIVWTGKEFVAVGDCGVIITSSDGDSWNMKKSEISMNLQEILWSGKSLVTYGTDYYKNKSVILYSTDSVEWFAKEFAQTFIDSMAFNNGTFLALIHNTNKAMISADGIYWDKLDTPVQTADSFLTSFNGNFIIYNEPRKIYISNDGFLWKETNIAVDERYRLFEHEICTANGFLLLSGNTSEAVYTENISDWNLIQQNEISKTSGMSSVRDLIYFKEQYIGIVADGSFIISKDFKTWQRIDVRPIFTLDSIASNGKTYLTVGCEGVAYVSSDGLAWTECNTNTKTDFICVIWNGKQFVALDRNGIIYGTEDGTEWKVISSFPYPFIEDWSNVKFKFIQNKYFMITSYSNTFIWSSEDLKKWDKIDFDGYVSDIASNDKVFVAVGYNIFSSTDANNWSKRTSSDFSRCNKVFWNGTQFVAFGNDNKSLISKDGITWTTVSKNTTDDLDHILITRDISWNGKEYLALDTNCDIVYSTNGINWSISDLPHAGNYAIAWTGYRYILVGDYSIKTAIPKDIIKVLVNGKPIIFDVAPKMSKNRTLVPARYVFEALGADVQWDEKQKL